MLPVLGRLLHKPKGALYAAWGGVEAVRYAVAHRFGSIDIDVHVSRDDILMAVHWPREWLLDGKPLGPIRTYTASELARAVPKNGGPWRIQPVATLLAEGRDRIVFCLEAKPDEALELASTWARVKADADRYGCRVVVMTIQRQGTHPIAWEAAAERRLRAAKTAGLPVMVLSRAWLDPAKWEFVDAWKVNKRAELRWGKDMPQRIPYVGPGSPFGATAHPKTRIPVLAAPTTTTTAPPEVTMQICQNGWPALASDSKRLHTWVVPTKEGDVKLRLREGSAGFLLAHFALWYAEVIEPLVGKIHDDWGYAPRKVRGSATSVSNHAGGLAIDLNATRHPLGKTGTFTPKQYAAIDNRLALYDGCLRSGTNYRRRRDDMHTEIDKPLADCERVARKLMDSPRGKRILAANPSQKAVILS